MFSVAAFLLFASAAPAGAATTDPGLGEVGIVAPTSGQVTYNRSDCDDPTINQWMYWNTDRRISGLRDAADGGRRAYEHEANFNAYPGDYDYTPLTNLPTYYQDTAVLDPGFNRAGGSAASRVMTINTWYYYTLQLNTPSICIGSDIRYSVKTQRSYRQSTCPGGYALCVYAKPGYPRDIVPISAGYRTDGTTHGYNYNQLQNPSFDLSTSPQGWGLLGGAGGSANWATYTGAYEGSRYLQFNCANTVAGCSIYQDKSFGVHPDHQFTYEVALRCTGTSSCPVTLRLWGLDITGTEAAGTSETVPNDGLWHRYKFRGANFQSHLRLRWQVYNQHPSNNVAVDFTTLMWSDRF